MDRASEEQMEENEGWLIPLLETVRRRPAMYLAGSSDVNVLALYCHSYGQGRDSVDQEKSGAKELRVLTEEFVDWLTPQDKPRMRLLGWVGLVERKAEERGESDSVGVFFLLFDEFLRSRSLDKRRVKHEEAE
ncbi:MAG: hypothetical protein JNJ54_25915 [Myxococcaceae bacterium]|nr:hypothetical protein [Myxococcaceae bacterium]